MPRDTHEDRTAPRPPRLAFLTLPGLGHFAPDLLAALPCPGTLEVRAFEIRRHADLAAALEWTDDPARDALWFEFCWPPFPAMIARTEFGGRRVLVRVHRIEAYGTDHAAGAPWHKVDEAVVVAEDMAGRLRAAVPGIEAGGTRITVLHNGVDLDRFRPAATPADPHRIGWCGWLSLHKNPNLALEILHRLRTGSEAAPWTLHLATRGAEAVAADSFVHLARRMGLEDAVHIIEGIPQARMPEWHAANAVLLSTSVYESFGYAIAEAAAIGCDLAVLDNPGAGEFWPEAVRFATVDAAVARIRAARPHRWRGLIESRFSLAAQAEAVRCLLRAAPPRRREAGGGNAVVVPIRHAPASWQGRFLVRDRTDPRQRRIAETGGFDDGELLEDLRGRLAPGDLFLDIGAQAGERALFATGVCGARAVAWVPSETLARHGRDNLTLNGLEARAEMRVADPAAMPAPRDPPGGRVPDDAEENGGAFPRFDADPAWAPTAMRVDAEGREAAFLRGARAMLRRHRPALYVAARTPDAFLALRDVLDPLGYAPAENFGAAPTWLFLPGEATEADAAAAQPFGRSR